MTYLLSFLRRQESSLINLQLSNISVKNLPNNWLLSTFYKYFIGLTKMSVPKPIPPIGT